MWCSCMLQGVRARVSRCSCACVCQRTQGVPPVHVHLLRAAFPLVAVLPGRQLCVQGTAVCRQTCAVQASAAGSQHLHAAQHRGAAAGPVDQHSTAEAETYTNHQHSTGRTCANPAGLSCGICTCSCCCCCCRAAAHAHTDQKQPHGSAGRFARSGCSSGREAGQGFWARGQPAARSPGGWQQQPQRQPGDGAKAAGAAAGGT